MQVKVICRMIGKTSSRDVSISNVVDHEKITDDARNIIYLRDSQVKELFGEEPFDMYVYLQFDDEVFVVKNVMYDEQIGVYSVVYPTVRPRMKPCIKDIKCPCNTFTEEDKIGNCDWDDEKQTCKYIIDTKN